LLFFSSSLLVRVATATESNYYENNDKVYIIKGKAKLGRNKQRAKDKAMQEAFITALTKKIERLISKEKFELQYALIDEKILTKNQKFIKRFIIKKQGIVHKNYEVEIHMSLDETKLKKILASIGLLFTPQDYYKGLLLTSVRTISSPTPQFWWGDDTLDKKSKTFMENIFAKPEITTPIVLVNPFELDLQDKIPGDLTKLHLSVDELQTIGNLLSTDIIIYGNITLQAETDQQGKKNIQLISSFRSINVKTGRNISHTNYSGTFNMPQKLGSIEDKIVKKALLKNLKKTTKNIIATWVNGTYNSTEYNLSLAGILNFKEFSLLKYFLKNDIKSINAIEDHILSKNKKVLKIESNLPLIDVSREIESASIENFKLEVLPSSDEENLQIIVKRL
jgi:hypothetical protein